MFKRVETCFPITEKKLAERILNDLKMYSLDNTQAWLLQSDGEYKHLTSTDAPAYQVQGELLKSIAG